MSAPVSAMITSATAVEIPGIVTIRSRAPRKGVSTTSIRVVSSSMARVCWSMRSKWTLVSGSSLPPGLKLSSKGVISGKAKTAGTYAFTVQVADTKTKTNPKRLNTATATLSITIS
jgi:hypothetical protein